MTEFTDASCLPIEALVPPEASSLHHRFFAHWLALRGSRAMPSYADFDPVDVPWALAHIFVVEIRPDGDFVYRLASQSHAERYRRNLKGARVTDIMQKDGAEAILARWRTVRDMPAAFFIVTDHKSSLGLHVLGERMVLPMSDNGTVPTHIVGITNFVSESNLADALLGDQRVKLFRWSRLGAAD